MPQTEPWLRGIKSPDLHPAFQPIVDAWAGALEDCQRYLSGFNDRYLWTKPAGMASVGFHLEHMRGVIDRLLTYSEQKSLSSEQFRFLQEEGQEKAGISSRQLLAQLEETIHAGHDRLVGLSNEDMAATRTVGRRQLPSTLIGLCFHSAEHITRHTGALIVTARVVPLLHYDHHS